MLDKVIVKMILARFTKKKTTIIPLLLVGYEIVIKANSYQIVYAIME